jgi:hypothetical protein
MENIHANYDAVFKDALTLFKDKTLDFLGLHNIAPIKEPLPTENTQIEVQVEFLDLLFQTADNKGLHIEEEVNLSMDDMYRFGEYHVRYSRTFKITFITVIFVKEPTSIRTIETEQFAFRLIIVQCSKFDADKILARLKEAVSEGLPFNELELIYLPLFKSIKYTPTELFLQSARLVKDMHGDVNYKQKMAALLIALGNKVVDKAALDEFAEEVKSMGNVIIEYFEEKAEKRGLELGEKRGLELGEKRGKRLANEDSARKMIEKGYDLTDIADITGIHLERLYEIKDAQ